MPYKINSINGELAEYAFDFGGMVMLRNFTARVDGERLIIHSAKNQNFAILEALASEVEIDGVVYDNPTAAQEAINRLVFNAKVPVVITEEERKKIVNAIQKDPEATGKILMANGQTLSKTELKGDTGERGQRGERGEQGIQGIQGVQGQRGERGADGKSAYQSWLDAGNQGTEQDFLNWLKPSASGLSEEEKQQLLKKGTTRDVLLANGETIPKEDLLSGQTSIADDQFEFKFQDKWLWWKLKNADSSDWKKLLHNYELRPFDNQALDAKIINNRIHIKKAGQDDSKYKELLMGQWVRAFKYKVLDNKQIQWISGNYKSEWTDMPLIATEENRRNTEGNMMIRVNTLRFVEGGQERHINVDYPETFHIKILDGNYLQWKKTSEDDTQWKRLPFHGENFHRKYALQARVQNGVVQYKFEFEDDNEYKDLVTTKDLFPVEGVKVISTKNVVGDTRAWLNVLFAHHRNILIKAGRYDLEALTNVGIRIHSNSNIMSEEGVELKVMPTPLPHFSMFRLEDVRNVSIRGGLLIGDKEEHQWVNPKEDNYLYRSEHIHGVYVANSENIKIENLTAKDFIGDGMLLSQANNVYVRNVKLYNARMEGLGIRSSDNVVFDTCEFSFTKPAQASNFRNLGYGVDIEPIYNRNHFRNIKFLNCTFEDNGGFEPSGFTLSTNQHGSMKYKFHPENEFVPTYVSVELINPVFKGCGMLICVPTNWTYGYLRVFNATVINSKRFGVVFFDHNGDNFHTYIDGLKLIDCGTELHWTGDEPQYYSRPLCFYSSKNGNDVINVEQGGKNQNKGNKNIHIKNVELINTGAVTYRKAAVTVYANPDKANDLENVQVENLKVVGYQKVFENLSKHEIHKSFQLTQHPETELLNSDVVNKDVEIGNDSVHTFLNKTTPGNILYKDEIYPSNLEYYAKNASQGEVKLKFESATDIEGLAYGIREFALARGKRLKMRKIGANRWEYLEGTASVQESALPPAPSVPFEVITVVARYVSDSSTEIATTSNSYEDFRVITHSESATYEYNNTGNMKILHNGNNQNGDVTIRIERPEIIGFFANHNAASNAVSIKSVDVSNCKNLGTLTVWNNAELTTIYVSQQQMEKINSGQLPGWNKPSGANYIVNNQIT